MVNTVIKFELKVGHLKRTPLGAPPPPHFYNVKNLDKFQCFLLWMVPGQQILTKSKYLEKNPSTFSLQVQVTSLLGQIK